MGGSSSFSTLTYWSIIPCKLTLLSICLYYSTFQAWHNDKYYSSRYYISRLLLRWLSNYRNTKYFVCLRVVQASVKHRVIRTSISWRIWFGGIPFQYCFKGEHNIMTKMWLTDFPCLICRKVATWHYTKQGLYGLTFWSVKKRYWNFRYRSNMSLTSISKTVFC